MENIQKTIRIWNIPQNGDVGVLRAPKIIGVEISLRSPPRKCPKVDMLGPKWHFQEKQVIFPNLCQSSINLDGLIILIILVHGCIFFLWPFGSFMWVVELGSRKIREYMS